MPKITPFLWFDDNAEEAMNLYCSIFKSAKIKGVTRYTAAGPGKEGSVMTADFDLEGQAFTALNGGPHFKFTEAVSFVVQCKTQDEVDHYWNKLLANGGEASQCGWLKDKFGLSWQIVPDALIEILGDQDLTKVARVMQAMMKMVKLDVAALQQAYEGA